MNNNQNPSGRLVGDAATSAPEEQKWEQGLRPQSLSDYTGQDVVRAKLEIFIAAATKRQESLDHVLVYGPPGLGKTSLAHVIAHEMGSELRQTSGPTLERQGDLVAILSNLEPGDVLFIDEIHRLSPVVEEILYPAMEDSQVDIVIGDGPAARAIKLNLPRFTLVGATTRFGLLSSPLRDRFGIVERLEFYNFTDLEKIIERSAGILAVEIERAGLREIAKRSRGTPRIANRLLRRVRDFAEVKGDGVITEQIAINALDLLQVDHAGIDHMDRKFITILMDHFSGGPVGIESLAAAMGEDKGTLEEVLEPYLIQQGFINRTTRGRMLGQKAWEHMERTPPKQQRYTSELFKEDSDGN